MKDKVYWTMRNGQKINVDDMDINHLRNSLKMLIRNIDAINIKRATRREFVVNGEMAQEDADKYELHQYFRNHCEEWHAENEIMDIDDMTERLLTNNKY